MVKNSIDVALGMFEDCEREGEYCGKVREGGFEVIYSERQGVVYNFENEKVLVRKVDEESLVAKCEVNGLCKEVKVKEGTKVGDVIRLGK